MKMRSAPTVPGSSQMTTMEKTGFDVANSLNGHTQHVRIPEMLGLFLKDVNLNKNTP